MLNTMLQFHLDVFVFVTVLDRVFWSAGTILQGAKVDLRMSRGRLS